MRKDVLTILVIAFVTLGWFILSGKQTNPRSPAPLAVKAPAVDGSISAHANLQPVLPAVAAAPGGNTVERLNQDLQQKNVAAKKVEADGSYADPGVSLPDDFRAQLKSPHAPLAEDLKEQLANKKASLPKEMHEQLTGQADLSDDFAEQLHSRPDENVTVP